MLWLWHLWGKKTPTQTKPKTTRYFYSCQDLFKEMQEHCFVERFFNYVKTSPEPLELGWVFPSSWIAGASRIRKHVSLRIWTLGNITPLRHEPSFISFNHSGFGFRAMFQHALLMQFYIEILKAHLLFSKTKKLFSKSVSCGSDFWLPWASSHVLTARSLQQSSDCWDPS